MKTNNDVDSELAARALIGDGALYRVIQYHLHAQRDLAETVANLLTKFSAVKSTRKLTGRTCFKFIFIPRSRARSSSALPKVDGLAFGLALTEKRVPKEFFVTDRSGCAFLRHLWATDGCIG